MRWLVLAAFVVAGCLQAEAPDGLLTCSDVPGRLCPENYYCAPDKTCWHNGHAYFVPDMASRRLPPFPRFDFSLPVDNGDMAIPTPPSDLSSSD